MYLLVPSKLIYYYNELFYADVKRKVMHLTLMEYVRSIDVYLEITRFVFLTEYLLTSCLLFCENCWSDIVSDVSLSAQSFNSRTLTAHKGYNVSN